MEDRIARVGENEAVFREVNERIERITASMEVTTDRMTILCECGIVSCTEPIEVAIVDYERVRADPALFFVRPGHDLTDVEDVVEEQQEFHVVRKKPGEPSELARRLDPRTSYDE